ncbi:MAG: cohesin domain-containing protein [Candidatus Zixiibacteriota bacterium]
MKILAKATIVIILITIGLVLGSEMEDAVIDSVWFNQENDCDGENIVEVCYSLTGGIADIGIEASADSGETWESDLLHSISGDDGDIGSDIEPGEHCFLWDYGTDYPGEESMRWMIKAKMTSFLDTFIVIDSIDISHRPQYGWGLGYGDENFWIYDYGNGYIYKSSCISCPAGDSFYVGRLNNADIDYDGGNVYFASAGGNPRVIEVFNTRTGIRDTIAIMPEYYSGVQGVHAMGDDLYFTWYGDPPNPRFMMHINLSDSWPVSEWDTLLTSSEDTCHTTEGLAYANGYLWSSNNFARMTQITLDPPEYTGCYPIPNTGSGSEGLCFDGQYMWFMNGGTRKIYKIMITDSTSANQIANAPTDSRAPDVHIYCPADTFINGDTCTIEWAVLDMFTSSEPCSLFIRHEEFAETTMVSGREYDFVIPEDIVEASYVNFRIASRDSFCNWSSAECSVYVWPVWYANIHIEEYIACPGETIMVPILLDSTERAGISSIDIEIDSDPEVFVPINAISEGSITAGWTSDFIDVFPEDGNMHFGMSSEASFDAYTSGELVYIKGYIPVDAEGGNFANIDFGDIEFNSGMPILTGESGMIAVCVSPDTWIANLRFSSSEEARETRLSIGVTSDATEMYDAGLDLIILPTTPDRMDARLLIVDPENPHIAGLRRDLRPISPPQIWQVIANENGEVSWNPSVFPDGIFTLNNHIDMKSQSHADFFAGDTIAIEWKLPDIELGNIEFEPGWNLVSLPLLPAISANEIFSFSPVDIFGYNAAERRYYAIDDIAPGMGFWVFALSDTNINIAGYPLDSYQIVIERGWNIIGAPYSSYLSDDIATVPDGIIISGPYSYETGSTYIEASELLPGSGYWLLISEDGILRVIPE